MPTRRLVVVYFSPLNHVTGIELDRLEARLLSELGTSVFPHFRTLYSRGTFWLEVPLGGFAGNLSHGAVNLSTELQARDALIEDIRRQAGALPFEALRDMREVDGVWYYREKALAAFRLYARRNELFVALYHFLRAAKADKTLILGIKPRRSTPLEDRPVVNGRRARGAAWTPAEDKVLRQWFGRWPDGKHHKLTEAQWKTVLEVSLQGRRPQGSVLARLSVLNTKLKRSLMVDGYVPTASLAVYRRDFLGQRIRVPQFRHRHDGTYYRASLLPKSS